MWGKKKIELQKEEERKRLNNREESNFLKRKTIKEGIQR